MKPFDHSIVSFLFVSTVLVTIVKMFRRFCICCNKNTYIFWQGYSNAINFYSLSTWWQNSELRQSRWFFIIYYPLFTVILLKTTLSQVCSYVIFVPHVLVKHCFSSSCFTMNINVDFPFVNLIIEWIQLSEILFGQFFFNVWNTRFYFYLFGRTSFDFFSYQISKIFHILLNWTWFSSTMSFSGLWQLL